MEVFIYILVGIGLLFLYLSFANGVYRKFRSSRGLSRLFWLLILFGTLSFIFGSSGASNNTNDNFSNGEDNHNDCNIFDFCDDSSSYDNSNSWDNSDSMNWDDD